MTGRNKELMCYTVYQVKCSHSANNRRMWYSVKHIICPPRGIAVTVKSALCEFKLCWDPWLKWSLKIVVLNQMTWFVLLPWLHCTSCLFVTTVRLKSFFKEWLRYLWVVWIGTWNTNKAQTSHFIFSENVQLAVSYFAVLECSEHVLDVEKNKKKTQHQIFRFIGFLYLI